MNYEEWELSVPRSIADDPLWRMKVYKLALFAADIGWHDVTKLSQDKRTVALSGQLYKALGSISANIAEGYSRNSSKDQARFYEYALGSARESPDWYYKARPVLGEPVMLHRLDLLTNVIRLLLTIIPSQRGQFLREEPTIYEVDEEQRSLDTQDARRNTEADMTLIENTRFLSPIWARYTDILVERGEGACLYAADGRSYLDFTCGIGVTNTGHCHPRVVAAIREQAGRLLHGQANIIYHKPMLELVGALREVVNPALDSFFFSNSGAEAVEGAIKLARHATGRTEVIVFGGAFHGRTAGTMALTSSKGKYRGGYPNLPSGIHFAPYAYCYQCAVARAAGKDAAAISQAAPRDEGCCGEPLRQLRHLLQTETVPEDVAAILVEPVQGEGGYIVPPASFIQGLRQICDEYSILLVADEVQTGFGRTGAFFAMEHFDVTPDIMTIAKGIASGLPLSGVAARRELMEKWHTGSHGGTYGGNAVACAAAVATIGAIREERLVENAARLGGILKCELAGVQGRNPAVGDVRGLGLMVGVELVGEGGAPDGALAKRVLAGCRERGLLLLNCGPYDNVVRFIPPLVVDENQVRQAVRIFEESLQS